MDVTQRSWNWPRWKPTSVVSRLWLRKKNPDQSFLYVGGEQGETRADQLTKIKSRTIKKEKYKSG